MAEEKLGPKSNLLLSEDWQYVVEEKWGCEPREIVFLRCFHRPAWCGCRWWYPPPNNAFFPSTCSCHHAKILCFTYTFPLHVCLGGSSLGPAPAEVPAPVDPSIPALLSRGWGHPGNPQRASTGKRLEVGFVCGGNHPLWALRFPPAAKRRRGPSRV